jgi:hypothetical protein
MLHASCFMLHASCFMHILTRLSAGTPMAEIPIPIRRRSVHIHTALSHLSLLANPGTRRTLAQNSIAGRKENFSHKLALLTS